MEETATTLALKNFAPCDGGSKVGPREVRGCRARSFYFATVNGVVLSFCAHHGTAYEAALRKQATKIVDLRHLVLDD